MQPAVRASVAVRDADRPQLDGDPEAARHVQGGVRRLRPQRGGEDGGGRRGGDQRQQGAEAGRVQGPVHRGERQVHPEGGQGVRLLQRLHVGPHEPPAGGGQVPAPQVHPVPDAQVGGGEQGPRPPGLPPRRPRHRLLLHAGRRHGHRPPRGLLPLPRLRPPRRAILGHHQRRRIASPPAAAGRPAPRSSVHGSRSIQVFYMHLFLGVVFSSFFFFCLEIRW